MPEMIRLGTSTRSPRRPRIGLVASVLLLLAAGVGGGATRWSWLAKPYDARPLLQNAAPAADGSFTFAVFGDSYAVPALEGLLKAVDARHPTFAVTTGDMVASGGGANDEAQWRMLSDRAGWFMRDYPTWPVIGNHELHGDYDSGLHSFLDFYGLGDQSYSFTFGKAKFIVLGHDRAGRPAPSDQVEFAKRELQHREQYAQVFVFRHVPFYTVGDKSASEVPNTETALVKLFGKAHVTAVFAGHDHTYYRTRRDGVNYLISGSAGAGVYRLRRTREGIAGDVYMGARASGQGEVLHRPGSPDRELTGSDLFAVFIHISDQGVTGETVSASGDIWDRFTLR